MKQPLELIVDAEITLRQFTIADTWAIFDLIDRDRAHMGQNGDKTVKIYPHRRSALESIQNPSNPDSLRFGIWIAGNTLAGSINITPDTASDRAEIGYYLSHEFEGREYMAQSLRRLVAYALDNMRQSTVYARVHNNDERSKKVLAKAGFLKNDSLSNSADVCYVLEKPR